MAACEPIPPVRPGVSVVICCHNSSGRISPTLSHLAAQQVRKDLPWEVLIIDNASTDDTANVAKACWPADAPAPMRVVSEPRSGLTHARERGFREASYEFVSLIDDDNWICPEWVARVSEVMTAHSDVGVCGSVNDAVCEVPPPWWFGRFKTVLAVTADDTPVGDLTPSGEVVLGAGMTVRLSAWRALFARGYSQIVMDRQGKTLNAGGDSEICLALRLAGWRIMRDPQLRLQHFLPANRLRWGYIRKLYRGYGVSSIMLDGYQLLDGEDEAVWKRPFRKSWQWHMLASALFLLKHPAKLIRALLMPLEGDPDTPMLEIQFGRMIGLLRNRGAYCEGRAHVRRFFRPLRELQKS